MGYKKGDCVHWPAIEACLTDGPAPIGLLTMDMYGEDSEVNRRAARLVMMRMVRQERVVRLRSSWFALPGKTGEWNVFTTDALARYLKKYPRTTEEVAAHFHITENHVLRQIRRLPGVRKAVAPRWRWPGRRYCYLYSLAPPTVLARALGSRQKGWAA